ncbi:uncharacterized protein METZ01_LOCUS73425 [marine metagenome]|uniref:Uncharacterized protein n=1 Tax=marine metagenome TaxID=408172 RepID=A0A381TYP0_9ZZZZ
MTKETNDLRSAFSPGPLGWSESTKGD